MSPVLCLFALGLPQILIFHVTVVRLVPLWTHLKMWINLRAFLETPNLKKLESMASLCNFVIWTDGSDFSSHFRKVLRRVLSQSPNAKTCG